MAIQEKTTVPTGSLPVSGMAEIAALDGEVLLPVVRGKNYRTTLAVLKNFINHGMVEAVEGKGLSTNDYSTADKNKLAALPTNEQLTTTLNDKLDKEVWDERNKQFGLSGYYHKTTGVLTAGATFVNSGLLPLNREEDIVYFGSSSGNAASVSFFDATQTHVSSVQYTGAAAEHVIAKADFPEAAVYFAVTCLASVDNRRYSNGTTVESREGATAEAIERSKKALFIDMWENCSNPVLAYKYYPSTDTYGVEAKTHLSEATTIEATKYLLKDLSLEEAITSYKGKMQPIITIDCITGRMNIVASNYQRGSGPTYDVMSKNMAVYNNVEVIMLSAPAIDVTVKDTVVVDNCNKAKAIIGRFLHSYKNPLSFSFLETAKPVLEYMTPIIREDFNIHWFAKLSLFTMKYIVEHAANTKAITVTVHPDVYAKLTNDEVAEYVPANLLLGSDEGVTTSEYLMKDYYFGDVKPKEGDKVTITIWGELGEGKTAFAIFNSGDNAVAIPYATLVKINDGVYTGSANWSIKTNSGTNASNTFVRVYNYKSTVVAESTINKIKLEFGENTDPVWTPALEEIEDEELREKAQWAALVGQAAAKQIQFVTTE